MIDDTFTRVSQEVERLTTAELQAAHHYYEALSQSDVDAAQDAAAAWMRASDALIEYLLQGIVAVLANATDQAVAVN